MVLVLLALWGLRNYKKREAQKKKKKTRAGKTSPGAENPKTRKPTSAPFGGGIQKSTSLLFGGRNKQRGHIPVHRNYSTGHLVGPLCCTFSGRILLNLTWNG
jgi:hypothetical protein